MKIVYLTGTVNKEMVDRVCDSLNGEDKVRFYLNSQGGERPCSRIIVDIINLNKNRVELIAQHDISSAAFRIFWRSECRKHIMPHTTSIWHSGTKDNVDLGHDGRPYYYFQRKETKHFVKDNKKQIEETKKLGFTKKEMKLFKKGEDVFLSYKRLIKLFPKAKEAING